MFDLKYYDIIFSLTKTKTKKAISCGVKDFIPSSKRQNGSILKNILTGDKLPIKEQQLSFKIYENYINEYNKYFKI
jgi:hypothetical protein